MQSFTTYMLLLVGMGFALLGAYAIGLRRNRFTFFFTMVVYLQAVWNVSLYVELTAESMSLRILCNQVKYVAALWIAQNWLAMLQALSGKRLKWLNRWVWGVVLLFPVVGTVLIVSMQHNDWLRYGFEMAQNGPFYTLIYQRTSLDHVFSMGGNILGILILGAMLQLLWSAKGKSKSQMLLLFLSFFVAWVPSMLFALGITPVKDMNILPFIVGISGVLMAWAVLGYRILDVVPIAREWLVDHLRGGVLVLDALDAISYVNKTCVEMLAVPADCVGRHWRILPEHLHAIVQLGRGLECGQQLEREFCFRDLWFDVSVDSLSQAADRQIGVMFVFRNVTRSKAEKLLLEKSEKELQMVVDSMSEAVFLHDEYGEVLWVNQAMLTMYGIPDLETALNYRIVEDYSMRDGQPRQFAAVIKRAKTGERVRIKAWRARRPLTGDEFAACVMVQEGVYEGRTCMVATVTDLTEMKKQEALLARAKYLRQLESITRDMHDGVAGIMANISMVSMGGLAETDEAAWREALENINLLAQEGNMEIRSLMNSMESGKMYWSDWLTEIRRFGELVLSGQGITFRVQVVGEPRQPAVDVHAGTSLMRVLKEGVVNSARHSQATQVDWCVEFMENGLRMTLADNGGGRSTADGSGRGLKNMFKRIDELRGSIDFSSCNGFGVRIWIPIPDKYPD